MTKPARRRTDNVVAMPPRDEPAIPSENHHDAIARRAYELFCARGREDGHDLDDWLSAERELRQAARHAAA